MRKKALSVTISEDSCRFIEGIAEELGMARSAAIDLIVDAASGNLGTHMIIHHYHSGYDRKDGRKKERLT